MNASPVRADRVSDPRSSLECRLTIVRGGDSGVHAVVVELLNAADDSSVVLKINTEISAFCMLTVTDRQGTVLSKPARKFNSAEHQKFNTVRIGPASSHRWRRPIVSQLDASAIPERGLEGRLVVNVALLFSRVKGDARPADADFASSLLTLYDMNVLFTRKALA